MSKGLPGPVPPLRRVAGGTGHANVAPGTGEWHLSPVRDIRMSRQREAGISQPHAKPQAATVAGLDSRLASGAGVWLVPRKSLGRARRITLCQAEPTWRGSEPVLYSRP